MKVLNCIGKIRDANGRIKAYRLVTLDAVVLDVEANKLKEAVRREEVCILNLTLTADGRLVDAKEEGVKSAGKTPNTTAQQIEDRLMTLLMNKGYTVQRIGVYVNFIYYNNETKQYYRLAKTMPVICTPVPCPYLELFAYLVPSESYVEFAKKDGAIAKASDYPRGKITVVPFIATSGGMAELDHTVETTEKGLIKALETYTQEHPQDINNALRLLRAMGAR